jgi:hypothetical protein
MPLQLLKYNPGIVKDITQYSAGKNGPYWVDGDLVRFRNGYPTKVGGWEKDVITALNADGSITSTETSITGIGRKMVYWRAISDGEDRIAVGTHNHLYIIENGALYDITPLRDSTDAATTTAEALDAIETEIDLVSVEGFKDAGAIIIDAEIITYTGISTNTLTGCTRGTNGTTAATHDIGAITTQVLINPIATQSGSTTVIITDTDHGALDGDWIVLNGASAVGGVTADDLNRRSGYQITLIDTDSYSIQVPSAATSTVATGGGLVIIIQYLIGGDAQLGAQSSAPH